MDVNTPMKLCKGSLCLGSAGLGKMKPLTAFKTPRSKYCIECHKEVRKQYYQNQPEKLTNKRQSYYQKNKDYLKLVAQKWNKNARENFKKNPRPILRALVGAARKRALDKQWEFDLTIDWVCDQFKNQLGRCFLTDIQFEVGTEPGVPGPYTPSLDRMDSTLGYTKNNVRLVCWVLNNAMNRYGLEFLREVMIQMLKKEGYTIIPPVNHLTTVIESSIPKEEPLLGEVG